MGEPAINRTVKYTAAFDFDGLKRDLAALASITSDLNALVERFGQGQKTTSSSTRAAGEAAQAAAGDLGAYRRSTDQARDASGRFTKATAQARADIVSLDAALNVASRGIGLFRKAIEAAAKPVDLAVTFERAFNEVRTLSDEVGDELKGQLLELAKAVPQTAEDVTRAAYQAISAGVAIAPTSPMPASACPCSSAEAIAASAIRPSSGKARPGPMKP